MNRRHLTLAVLAGLLAAAPLAAVLPGATAAARSDTPPLATSTPPLAECLARPDRALAVLFAVDTSQSLKDEDPNAVRVDGLKGAIESLATVATTRDVLVDFITIGTGSERAFEWWSSFGSLAGATETLSESMERFAEQKYDQDTDYGAALVTAADVWKRAPADSCRLMVWFTDGEFDLDYQGIRKTIEWLDPPLELGSDDDEEEVMAAARDRICAPGGVADQFRESIGTEAGSGAFVIGVTLGTKPDYSFLRNIILNDTGECGELAAVGDVLQSVVVDGLVEQLIIAADPSLQKASLGPIWLSEAVESVRLRMSWPDANSDPVLVTPDDEQVPLGQDVSGRRLTNGATIDVLTEGGSQSVITITTPEQIGTWDGAWDVLSASGGPGTGEMYLQAVTGELRARLAQDDLVIRRGLTSTVALQLVSRSGAIRSAGAWQRAPESVMTAQWKGGEQSLLGKVKQDGQVPFELELREEFRADTLAVSATIRSFTEVFDGQPIELTAWEGALGELVVKDIPKSPIVEPIGSFDTPLNQDKTSAEALIRVRTEGEDSSGCLTLRSLELAGPQWEDVDMDIFDGETPLTVGVPCSAVFGADSERELVLRVSAPREVLRTPGQISGSFEFESISDSKDAARELFPQTFNVQVDPEYVTVRPSTWTWVAWLVLSLLVPLALLYGYNALIAAKVDVAPGLYALVPVTVGPDRITRRGTEQPSPLTIGNLAEHEITPIFDTGLHSSPVDLGPVQFRARPSAWPWGEPHGEMTVDGAALVVSTKGTTPTGRAGRADLTTARAWAYWSVDSAERAAPDSPGSDDGTATDAGDAGDGGDPFGVAPAAERHGMLLVLLPPVPYGDDITGLGPELDQALADAHDTVTAVYSTGTRPDWRTSLGRRFARPARPARPGHQPDVTTAGDTTGPATGPATDALVDADPYSGPSPF